MDRMEASLWEVARSAGNAGTMMMMSSRMMMTTWTKIVMLCTRIMIGMTRRSAASMTCQWVLPGAWPVGMEGVVRRRQVFPTAGYVGQAWLTRTLCLPECQ